jgi:putative FmdB family regulatory protein
MPTYEYLCASCGHRFETWQRITEDPLTTCPECGGQIKRVLFPAGIVFKGAGFYATDSRSASSASSPAEPAANGNSDSTPTATKSTGDGAAAAPAKSDAPSAPSAGGSTTTQAS